MCRLSLGYWRWAIDVSRFCQGGVDEGVLGVRDHASPQRSQYHPHGVQDSAGAGARCQGGDGKGKGRGKGKLIRSAIGSASFGRKRQQSE